MVSFSRVVKEDVVFNDFESCCQRAMLCAIIKINGTLSLSSYGLSLTIRTENAKIASKIHKMLKDEYDPQIEFIVSRKMKLKKNNVYILKVTKAREILDDLSLMDGLGFHIIPDKKIFQKECCIRVIIIALFLFNYYLFFQIKIKKNSFYCRTTPFNERYYKYSEIADRRKVKRVVKHRSYGNGSLHRNYYFYFEFTDNKGEKHEFQYEQQIHEYEVNILKDRIEAAKS